MPINRTFVEEQRDRAAAQRASNSTKSIYYRCSVRTHSVPLGRVQCAPPHHCRQIALLVIFIHTFPHAPSFAMDRSKKCSFAVCLFTGISCYRMLLFTFRNGLGVKCFIFFGGCFPVWLFAFVITLKCFSSIHISHLCHTTCEQEIKPFIRAFRRETIWKEQLT